MLQLKQNNQDDTENVVNTPNDLPEKQALEIKAYLMEYKNLHAVYID